MQKIIPFEILKIKDIGREKQRIKAILDYCHRHFSYFQNERSKIFPQIMRAIISNCKNFEFESWHRLIDYRYSDNPLSARGSILNDPGGRFNIGDIDIIKFPRFHALYIAEDYETAYREKFQLNVTEQFAGLTSEELSQNKRTSLVDIFVDGNLSNILDLTNKNTLKDFYNVISKIKLPKDLEKEAHRLNIDVMYHIKMYEQLMETVLSADWRKLPMQVDVPSNSQILGQLAYASGVEAILYPSRKGVKKKCLAIFIDNFKDSSAYVKVKDEVPPNVEDKILNSETFEKFK